MGWVGSTQQSGLPGSGVKHHLLGIRTICPFQSLHSNLSKSIQSYPNLRTSEALFSFKLGPLVWPLPLVPGSRLRCRAIAPGAMGQENRREKQRQLEWLFREVEAFDLARSPFFGARRIRRKRRCRTCLDMFLGDVVAFWGILVG